MSYFVAHHPHRSFWRSLPVKVRLSQLATFPVRAAASLEMYVDAVRVTIDDEGTAARFLIHDSVTSPSARRR